MFSVVGMRGILRSHLKYGAVHWMPFVLQNQVYASASLFLLMLASLQFAMYVLTCSGFLRSALPLSCLSAEAKHLCVFFAFPELVTLMRVFIISA